MNVVTIELTAGYFVEQDELNCTLKKRYMGTDKKTGEKKPAVKTIGYYKTVQDCLERLVRLICLDENEGVVIYLREYAEAAEKAFKRVEKWRKENYGKIDN
mgnify:CR=1 FL=1